MDVFSERTTMTIGREQMLDSKKDKDVESIEYVDFRIPYIKQMKNYDFTIFIDDDGSTKVVKNRFGDDGIVIKKPFTVADIKKGFIIKPAHHLEGKVNKVEDKGDGCYIIHYTSVDLKKQEIVYCKGEWTHSGHKIVNPENVEFYEPFNYKLN